MSSSSKLLLSQPITLPVSNLTLPNRLVKAAMFEDCADPSTNLPSPQLKAISSSWSTGSWGLILTGSTSIDPAQITTRSVLLNQPTLPEETAIISLKSWVDSFRPPILNTPPTPVIVQLNHPGKQSPRFASKTRGIFTPTLAPSAIPLNLGPGLLPKILRTLLFANPREMTVQEIQSVISNFAHSARVVAKAGFQGVQIHAAHGYLLCQFLSPSSNKRTDAYGGTATKRARIVLEVIAAVRGATNDFEGFAVGLKLNSVDHQQTNKTGMNDTMEQLRLIAKSELDFVEISGGSYEDPKPKEMVSESTKAREAFFLEFAKVAKRELAGVPLLVTGGFTTRLGMEEAVRRGDCDMVGLARPAIHDPLLPRNVILNPEVKDEDAKVKRVTVPVSWLLQKIPLKIVGAGVDAQFHVKKMQALGATRAEKAE
ncbi:putative NADH oxidase [Triangularia setosa]|uniref:NADH oxidase n=1 Tax=Triangularia setosa TaxID=2587417 RepID=A0AAN6WGR4_9PEZI|nr:putative NADH oxidase [Podospora setosa]